MKKSIKLTESQLQKVIKSISSNKKPLNEMDLDFRTDQSLEDEQTKREVKVCLLHVIRSLHKLSNKNPEVKSLIDQTAELMGNIESVIGKADLEKPRNNMSSGFKGSLN